LASGLRDIGKGQIDVLGGTRKEDLGRRLPRALLDQKIDAPFGKRKQTKR
jgi:hypothetical protein